MTDRDELLREIARMDASSKIQAAADRLRFQMEIALAAIKGLTIVNGGAILALLTFAGNAQGEIDSELLKTAFTNFAIGLAFALASYLGAFYSQNWFAHSEISDAWDYQRDLLRDQRVHTEVGNRERRYGYFAQIFALACMTTSLGSFVGGSFYAIKAIT